MIRDSNSNGGDEYSFQLSIDYCLYHHDDHLPPFIARYKDTIVTIANKQGTGGGQDGSLLSIVT